MKITVTKKQTEKSYKAGSGSLYIPILGWLFPKLFGQQMTENELYFIRCSNNMRYSVSKDVYKKYAMGDVFDEKDSIFN